MAFEYDKVFFREGPASEATQDTQGHQESRSVICKWQKQSPVFLVSFDSWLFDFNVQGEKGNRGPPGPPGSVSLSVPFST